MEQLHIFELFHKLCNCSIICERVLKMWNQKVEQVLKPESGSLWQSQMWFKGLTAIRNHNLNDSLSLRCDTQLKLEHCSAPWKSMLSPRFIVPIPLFEELFKIFGVCSTICGTVTHFQLTFSTLSGTVSLCVSLLGYYQILLWRESKLTGNMRKLEIKPAFYSWRKIMCLPNTLSRI